MASCSGRTGIVNSAKASPAASPAKCCERTLRSCSPRRRRAETRCLGGQELPAEFPWRTASGHRGLPCRIGRDRPSYRSARLMRDEYLPKTRARTACRACRRQGLVRVRGVDTRKATAGAIQIGSRGPPHPREMDKVMQRVGFKGTRDEFFRHLNRPAVLLGHARGTDRRLRRDQNASTRSCRSCSRSCPRPTMKCAPSSLPREERLGGSYQAASEDGSRPASSMRTPTTARASQVGHGGAVAARGQPRPPLPDHGPARAERLPRSPLRRYTAYSEGGPLRRVVGRTWPVPRPVPVFWPPEGELWRAIRLVVDTGLHAKAGRASRCSRTWTRTVRGRGAPRFRS